MKTTKEMVQGVKYPGYGFINEYNEFQFVPSEIGSRKEQKKLLVEKDGTTIYYTKNKIIFHTTIDRRLPKMERLKSIIAKMNDFIQTLREYDI